MPIATALGFLLLPVIGGLFMFIIKDPELARSLGLIGAKAQLAVGTADWPTYFGFMSQGVAIGGVILFGFVTTWILAASTATTPSRTWRRCPRRAVRWWRAKFVIAAAWCAVTATAVFLVTLPVGALVGLPQWPGALGTGLNSYAVSAGLCIALITPVAAVASMGRGYLPAMAFLFLALILAQVLAVMGWAGYFPWAVPSLYSEVTEGARSQLSAASYILVAATAALGYCATLQWWRRADQT
jgi:ABC-2 type transport system permease protein